MREIEQAAQVLIAEREAVLAGLAQERSAAERAAEEQRRWRADVQALLERGRAVGLSVSEMADSLGISRQWTNHLTKQAVDRELRKRAQALHSALGCPPMPPPDD